MQSVTPIYTIQQKSDGGFSGKDYEIEVAFNDPLEKNFYMAKIFPDIYKSPSHQVIGDEYTNGNQKSWNFSDEDLKQGTAIYSGSVDAMSNTKGFFELKAENNSQLMSALESLGIFSSVKERDNLIIAQISEDISASELNRKLFEKGIVLAHLQKKKESLETQFLELVKQNNL